MLLLSGWVTTVEIFSSGFLLTSAAEMVQCINGNLTLLKTWPCLRNVPGWEILVLFFVMLLLLKFSS